MRRPQFAELCARGHVQRVLSDEQHEAIFKQIKERSSTRMQNLLLACAMPHASDWLHAPPIPGLGLSMRSGSFRTAMKFRLGMPLLESGLKCPATSNKSGDTCGEELDVFGDHALCCHYGPSRCFRHNQLRDILGHTAKAAGLSAVVIEKKNQISGSKKKPGDITIQQYHRGFSSSAFDVTVAPSFAEETFRCCERCGWRGGARSTQQEASEISGGLQEGGYALRSFGLGVHWRRY